jgi:hypothetical protein
MAFPVQSFEVVRSAIALFGLGQPEITRWSSLTEP